MRAENAAEELADVGGYLTAPLWTGDDNKTWWMTQCLVWLCLADGAVFVECDRV